MAHAIRLRPRSLPLLALTALTALLPAAPLAGATHSVQILAGGFSPAIVVVDVGDRVEWTNQSGLPQNVVAFDGSFLLPGSPSAANWTAGHVFSTGGSFAYRSEGPGFFNGNVTVTGVFADGLESGSSLTWDLSVPDFHCTCYFSGDCNSGDFCNWGVLTQEDNCEWTLNKPNGVVGAGCDVLYPGVGWIGGICDGVCQPAAAGSLPGAENRALIREAIGHWTSSMLVPSMRPGGGPLDDGFARKALDLPFAHPESALQIGRQVADLLMLSGVPEFYLYFCRWESYNGGVEHHPPGANPDLSGQRCRAAFAQQLADALAAEVDTPGAGRALLAARPGICAGTGETLGGHRCADGSLDCLSDHVANLAVYLTTPLGGDLLKKALAKRVKL